MKEKILSLDQQDNFDDLALEVFQFQYENCEVYREFCNYFCKGLENVTTITDIPFLPVEFFKTHKVVTFAEKVETIFTSSGTTGVNTSLHYVKDLELYERNFTLIFERFYGPIEDFTILALLPSYLEREGSSLIYMVNNLIQKSNKKDSGFYLHNHADLYHKLTALESKKEKTILFGVTFALLDFVERFNLNLNHTIVMETGGMKGRRKEIIREELYDILKSGFGTEQIHSEYGMTELLSQAYSRRDGIFQLPPQMKIFLREPQDPLSLLFEENKSGVINIIDLANLYSCSFIATKDIGLNVKSKNIKILGRLDNSDIRGCSLLSLEN